MGENSKHLMAFQVAYIYFEVCLIIWGFMIFHSDMLLLPVSRKIENPFSLLVGNHRLSDSTMFGNPYQSLPIENTGGVRDVQFMDPAILAVGQGFENGSLDFRSNFQGNTNMFGNEVKLQQQLVMQSPLSSHQNCRFTGLNGSLGMASRLTNQTQGNNILSRNLALPNGHWDGLSNEIQSRNRLQNERLVGSTNVMPGYNGTFRI